MLLQIRKIFLQCVERLLEKIQTGIKDGKIWCVPHAFIITIPSLSGITTASLPPRLVKIPISQDVLIRLASALTLGLAMNPLRDHAE